MVDLEKFLIDCDINMNYVDMKDDIRNTEILKKNANTLKNFDMPDLTYLAKLKSSQLKMLKKRYKKELPDGVTKKIVLKKIDYILQLKEDMRI